MIGRACGWAQITVVVFCVRLCLRAAELDVVLVPPTDEIISGPTGTVWLTVFNISERQQRWTFPESFDGRVISPKHTNAVVLALHERSASREVVIERGQFQRRRYQFTQPVPLEGRVVLEGVGIDLRPAILDINPSPVVIVKSASQPATPMERLVKQAEPVRPGESFDAGRFFREHVSSYEPIYFIAGTESPNAKFQVSFKYQLLNNDGPLAQKLPPLTGFHVAYSQTSLWDWEAASAPFFDSSYRPEVLYLAENLTRAESNDWFRVDVQGGFQHESNGRDGFDSRSMNIGYLRPRVVFGKEDGLQLTLQPRAWTYIGDLSDNPDIEEYRGYADLRAIVGWQRGPQLSAIGRLGKDWNRESLQLDFTYPLMGFFPRSFSLYLHVQYFTGYGESLIRYNRRDSALRAGFSLTR